MIRKATKNGAANVERQRHCPVLGVARSPPDHLPQTSRLISGSSTVPAAMPITPIGSW